MNLAHSNYAVKEYLEDAKSDCYLEERREKAMQTLQLLNEQFKRHATAWMKFVNKTNIFCVLAVGKIQIWTNNLVFVL